MTAAAGTLGVDKGAIRAAKESGDIPQAFAGSRVHLPSAKKWIEDNKEKLAESPMTKEQADILLKRVRIEREKLALERDKGLLIRKTEVYETCKSISQHQRAVLQRKLETELPPKLLGLSVIEIAEEMRKLVDDICRIFHDRTKGYA
jgi:hypothetical protein